MPAKAGRRSFGRIRKLPSGQYQAGYVGPDLVTHYAEHTFSAKMDAEAWLAAERTATQVPTWMPPKVRRAYEEANRPPTLAEYAEGWLASRDLKPRTRALYEQIWSHRIALTLGDRLVTEITPTVVRAWYVALGPNQHTARAHAYSLLRSMLTTAVGEQIISANPCVIRGAGVAKRATKTEPATLEQLVVIVEHMPDRLRLAVLIAAWCSLRQGELLELRRQDIDLARGILRIRRAVVRLPGKAPIVGTPKSGAGVRDVAIPPHLMPEVERHLEVHVPPSKASLLFAGRDSGEQLASSTLYRWFYPAREAAGRPDLRWHDLRHTGATMAAVSGATLADLMKRLGHSTVGAALRYQHAVDGRDNELARRMSAQVSADGARKV